MRKQRKRKKTKRTGDRRRHLKFAGAVFLIILAVSLMVSTCQEHQGSEENGDLRGVWLSYTDFKELGLYNQTETDFRQNAERFFDKAEDCSVNTVYFHVRAFRDAAYLSERFPMSQYLWDRQETIPYDPLEIMTEMAHEYDMELHAWLNPYRNASFEEAILDPADESSTEEILQCIREIAENYPVDGIHFDDYFYEEGSSVSDQAKMEAVNGMVRSVYALVKEIDPDLKFGISPAGNVSYCESIGADVKTWLSEDGYVDYVIPQLYWTDEHTAQWRENMFSDTLEEWCRMNQNDTDLYIGLALYKAGTEEADDPGWENSDENLAIQTGKVRDAGCGGTVLFTASDLFRESAQKELENYRKQVDGTAN